MTDGRCCEPTDGSRLFFLTRRSSGPGKLKRFRGLLFGYYFVTLRRVVVLRGVGFTGSFVAK